MIDTERTPSRTELREPLVGRERVDALRRFCHRVVRGAATTLPGFSRLPSQYPIPHVLSQRGCDTFISWVKRCSQILFLVLIPFCLMAQDAPSLQKPLPVKRTKWASFKRMVTCRHEVIDWTFCTAIAAHVVAANYDARTTRRFIERGCPGNFRESNSWIYGKCPSMRRMTLIHLGVESGFGTMSYYFKKGLSEQAGPLPNYWEKQGYFLWALPQAAFVAGHTVAGRSNAAQVKAFDRTHAP